MNITAARSRRLIGIFLLTLFGLSGALTTGGLASGAQSAPLTAANPTPPAASYDCGYGSLKISGAKDTASVDYTVTIDQAPAGEGSTWAVTITAAPQPGHEFEPYATTEWTFTGTVDCLTTANPAAPAVTYDCADDELVIKGTKDTKSVDYTVTGPPPQRHPRRPRFWSLERCRQPDPGPPLCNWHLQRS
jgi:hypothetical protein